MSTRDEDIDLVTISVAPADGNDGEPPALTEDRVLALRPVASHLIHRLPNQHDLMNIDDDEVFARPILVTMDQGEFFDTTDET